MIRKIRHTHLGPCKLLNGYHFSDASELVIVWFVHFFLECGNLFCRVPLQIINNLLLVMQFNRPFLQLQEQIASAKKDIIQIDQLCKATINHLYINSPLYWLKSNVPLLTISYQPSSSFAKSWRRTRRVAWELTKANLMVREVKWINLSLLALLKRKREKKKKNITRARSLIFVLIFALLKKLTECKRETVQVVLFASTLSSRKISSENGFPPLFAITESTQDINCWTWAFFSTLSFVLLLNNTTLFLHIWIIFYINH